MTASYLAVASALTIMMLLPFIVNRCVTRYDAGNAWMFAVAPIIITCITTDNAAQTFGCVLLGAAIYPFIIGAPRFMALGFMMGLFGIGITSVLLILAAQFALYIVVGVVACVVLICATIVRMQRNEGWISVSSVLTMSTVIAVCYVWSLL